MVLQEAREALRARPQPVIQADGRGGAGDDADAGVAALHARVKGLEHSQISPGREVGVGCRALRVEAGPEVGLVPAFDVAHAVAEVGGEELAEPSEVVDGGRAHRIGGPWVVRVAAILRPRRGCGDSHEDPYACRAQVVDDAIQTGQLLLIVRALLGLQSAPADCDSYPLRIEDTDVLDR